MSVMRVGLVPHTDHKDAQHLFRSSLVVSRKASELERYGRAALGTLEQAAGVHRLVEVGACVVWGHNDAAIARVMGRYPHALMLVVLKAKPKKDSKVADMITRLEHGGHRVIHVVTIGAKAGVIAMDFRPGRSMLPAPDIKRPPQQQSAPSTPRAPVEPRRHTAPSTPRTTQ